MNLLKWLGDSVSRDLKELGDFLSADWWKGLAVIVTFLGIVLGSILTWGIFRLTQSNLDLAESNLEQVRQQNTARIKVTREVYLPVTDGVPQFEGDWLTRVDIVNYGPAPAGPVVVQSFLEDAPGGPALEIEPRTVRLFDSSLNETPNGLIAVAEHFFGYLRVEIPLLRPGERLDVVAEGTPAPELVGYAIDLHSEGLLYMRGHPLRLAAVPVPADSAHSDNIDYCVFGNGWVGGENVEGKLSPWKGFEGVHLRFWELRRVEDIRPCPYPLTRWWE